MRRPYLGHMADLGERLLGSTRVLPNYLEKLNQTAYQAIRDLIEIHDLREPAEIREHIRKQFRIWPVSVSVFRSIMIRPYPEDYNTIEGEVRRGYYAEAIVAYQGSKIFWKVLPQPGFRLPFTGKIGTHAVKFTRMLPSLDTTDFVSLVEGELPRIREALFHFQGDAYEWARRVEDRLDWMMRTF